MHCSRVAGCWRLWTELRGSIAESVRTISFFWITSRKILDSLDLRVGDMVLCPQNLGLKGLTGKIFWNKGLVDRLDGRTFFWKCNEERVGSAFVGTQRRVGARVVAFSFFRITLRKILDSLDLWFEDIVSCPQNLGSKGLTGKIFRNKELAADL